MHLIVKFVGSKASLHKAVLFRHKKINYHIIIIKIFKNRNSYIRKKKADMNHYWIYEYVVGSEQHIKVIKDE